MVKFTLKQCKYFEAVAQYGGLAQAAREINISQPAIAQAMDKLEHICGFKLFLRHHAKGFELTPKGRAVRTQFQKLLMQSEKSADAIEAIKCDILGTIKLGCFQSIAPFYVPKIIQEYKDKFPMIDVEVLELLQDEIVSKIIVKELDLAILYDLGLDQYPVMQWPLKVVEPYVILPKEHRLSKKKNISLLELKDDNYVLFDAPGSREYFSKLLTQVGIEPEVLFRSTSLEAVRSAVGNGMGFSILSMKPPSTTSYDGNEVVSVSIKDDIVPTSIVMISGEALTIPNMQQDFIDHCINVISRS